MTKNTSVPSERQAVAISKDVNEPAFPKTCEVDQYGNVMPDGMSLRDWLAGQAPIHMLVLIDEKISCGEMARRCYEFADAMLAEREKDDGYILSLIEEVERLRTALEAAEYRLTRYRGQLPPMVWQNLVESARAALQETDDDQDKMD